MNDDITRETKGQAKGKNSEWQELVTIAQQAILQQLPRVMECAYVHMIFSVMAMLSVRQKMPFIMHL